jgi:hypothetical protein
MSRLCSGSKGYGWTFATIPAPGTDTADHRPARIGPPSDPSWRSKEAKVGAWLYFFSEQSREISTVQIISSRRRSHFSGRNAAPCQCSNAALTLAPG